MEQNFVLGLMGLVTGIFGTMVGTGGGVILVPLLLIFSELSSENIAGTSLALVSINSFSGAFLFFRMGLVDRVSGRLFALAAIPGSIVAPFVVAEIGGNLFRVMFGLLLLGLASHMTARFISGIEYTSKLNHSQPGMLSIVRHIETRNGEIFDYQYNGGLAAVFNFIVGFISAFFGTGGGFLRTPVLVTAFGFPVKVAVATSMFALSIYATVGAAVHYYLGHIDFYPTLIFAGVGLLLGSQMGARVALRISSKWIVLALIGLLFVMGSRVLIQGVFW